MRLDRHGPHPATVKWPRRFRAVALCVVLALITVGCGNGETPDEEPGQEPEDEAGDEQTRAAEQELTVGVGGDPWVDSEYNRKSRPNYPLNADVCETLIRLTPEYELEPSIATDWEHTGNNVFRFSLDEDATFSDGTPVDAEAVKHSIDYTVEVEPETQYSFLGPESTTIVDEQTVEIEPISPNLRLIEQINHPIYSIVSTDTVPLEDPEVTCSGPFSVVEYTAEERLVVERNEEYWGEPAGLERITFRFFADDTTRALALQSGEVDMITDVPRGILSTLEEEAGIHIERSPVGQVMVLYMSRRDADGAEKMLNDPLLRRAVATAMDKEAYVQGVLDGNGEVADAVSPEAVFGEYADLIEGVDYDPEESERLLEEAGWELQDDGSRTRDGETLELEIVFAPLNVDLTTVEFIQAQLEEVGIGANINQLDPGAYSDRIAAGDYDLDVSPPNQNDVNPAFLLSLRWYSKSDIASAQINSPGPDTEFERLIDQTQETSDPDELQRLAAEAMHELMDEEVGAVALAGLYRIFAMNEQVQGFEPHPSGTNQRWSSVFIAE